MTKPHRVLIVDDDHAARWLVALAFQRRSIDVDVAETGKEALALFNRNAEKYCAVVLDLDIPPPDGLEIVRILRERGSRTSVVILTGHADLIERLGRANLGPALKLTLLKPADMNTIVDQVLAVCAP